MSKKIILLIVPSIIVLILSLVVIYNIKHVVVGKRNSDGTFVYNGTLYKPTPSDDVVKAFNRGKFLWKLDSLIDGTSIYAIENDNEGYIVIPSWDNHTSIFSPADKNLKISKGKNITSILFYNLKYSSYSDKADVQTIMSLEKLAGEEYSYKSESSGSFSVSVYGCYDNSAIATENVGKVAHIEDKWVFVPADSAIKSIQNNDKQYHGIVITDKDVIETLKRLTKL